jgi:hypothetical protein
MLETLAWVVIGLAAPWFAQRLRPRLAESLGGAIVDAEWMARGAYGILLPFGAWVTGAVVGREIGLQPPWERGSLPAVAAVAGGLLVAEGLLRRSHGRQALRRALGPTRSLSDLFDTPRWAMYRGAGWLWTGSGWAGALVAWVLVWAETVIRGGALPGPIRAEALGRLLWPTATVIVLGLSGNLWLTLAAQAGALWLVRADRS